MCRGWHFWLLWAMQAFWLLYSALRLLEWWVN